MPWPAPKIRATRKLRQLVKKEHRTRRDNARSHERRAQRFPQRRGFVEDGQRRGRMVFRSARLHLLLYLSRHCQSSAASTAGSSSSASITPSAPNEFVEAATRSPGEGHSDRSSAGTSGRGRTRRRATPMWRGSAAPCVEEVASGAIQVRSTGANHTTGHTRATTTGVERYSEHNPDAIRMDTRISRANPRPRARSEKSFERCRKRPRAATTRWRRTMTPRRRLVSAASWRCVGQAWARPASMRGRGVGVGSGLAAATRVVASNSVLRSS